MGSYFQIALRPGLASFFSIIHGVQSQALASFRNSPLRPDSSFGKSCLGRAILGSFRKMVANGGFDSISLSQFVRQNAPARPDSSFGKSCLRSANLGSFGNSGPCPAAPVLVISLTLRYKSC